MWRASNELEEPLASNSSIKVTDGGRTRRKRIDLWKIGGTLMYIALLGTTGYLITRLFQTSSELQSMKTQVNHLTARIGQLDAVIRKAESLANETQGYDNEAQQARNDVLAVDKRWNVLNETISELLFNAKGRVDALNTSLSHKPVFLGHGIDKRLWSKLPDEKEVWWGPEVASRLPVSNGTCLYCLATAYVESRQGQGVQFTATIDGKWSGGAWNQVVPYNDPKGTLGTEVVSTLVIGAQGNGIPSCRPLFRPINPLNSTAPTRAMYVNWVNVVFWNLGHKGCSPGEN